MHRKKCGNGKAKCLYAWADLFCAPTFPFWTSSLASWTTLRTLEAMQRYLKNLWWADQNWPHMDFFMRCSASIRFAACWNFSRALTHWEELLQVVVVRTQSKINENKTCASNSFSHIFLCLPVALICCTCWRISEKGELPRFWRLHPWNSAALQCTFLLVSCPLPQSPWHQHLWKHAVETHVRTPL